MSQKKKYSRYFIILQEDEKGYGLASDKAPTGYAKLEVKNNKCKVSFYVQNLKKEMKPYYILLICDKKDEKKLVKLGELNIDNTGRAEVSKEFTPENIAASGVSVDKVSGAAVVRSVDRNIISVLNGFSVTDIPKDWGKYTLIDTAEKRDNDEREIKDNNIIIDSKDRSFDEYEEKIEKIKTKEDSKIDKNIIEEEFQKSDSRDNSYKSSKESDSQDNRNEFFEDSESKDTNELESISEPVEIRSSEVINENEEDLESLNEENTDDIRNFKKHKHLKHESNKENKSKLKVKPVSNKENKDNKIKPKVEVNKESKVEPKSGNVINKEAKIEPKLNNKIEKENKVEPKFDNKVENETKIEPKSDNVAKKEFKSKTNNYNERVENINDIEIEKYKLDSAGNESVNQSAKEETNVNSNIYTSEQRDVLDNNKYMEGFYNQVNSNNNQGTQYENKNNFESNPNSAKTNYIPKTKSGRFFDGLTKNLQQWNDNFEELSKCKWYNIPIKSMEDMYKASSYNRYTILFYPMISYFPYIIRHGHYLFGYKYDKDGKVKYIIYGIPGTKAHYDQPFGGKFGFVSWVQGKNNKGKYGNMGYWLLFYDFRKSVIVIPVNK